ncbi:MAG: hypothetical protein ACMG57_04225 [Candidatus Dojkabacteria bacterium]
MSLDRPKTLDERFDEMSVDLLSKLKRILARKILHYSDDGGGNLIVLDKTIYGSDQVNLSAMLSWLGIEGVPMILNKVDSLGVLTTEVDKKVVVFRASKIFAVITKLGFTELTDVAVLDNITYKKITYTLPEDEDVDETDEGEAIVDRTITERPPGFIFPPKEG